MEIACSIKLKGCMIPGHGSVMNIIEKGDDVHVMICLLPIRDKEKEPDYIALALPWAKCSEDVSGPKSMENGMQFEASTPATGEEFMVSWEVLNSNRIERNNALDQAALAKKKTASRPKKRKDAAAQAAASDAAGTSVDAATDPRPSDVGESSRPKRVRGKRAAAGEGTDGPKELVYTLDEALLRGNKLTTKTKDVEVDAIYKALEAGLMQAFPYRHRRIPGLIHSSRLHIAPDELKYRKIIRDRLGQVSCSSLMPLLLCITSQFLSPFISRLLLCRLCRLPADTHMVNPILSAGSRYTFHLMFRIKSLTGFSRSLQVLTTYKGYGSIRKKPEIHAIPLKRAPIEGVDKGMDAVMDSCPAETDTIEEDSVTIPWWEGRNVHWYIIGGQHTVTAFRELASKHPEGSAAREELLQFEVIPIFSRDPEVLVRVSNALNLNIAEKVAKETYRSCAELGRAKWVAAGCPEPHRCGGKPSPAFDVSAFLIAAPLLRPFIVTHRLHPQSLCIGCQPIHLLLRC